jgi:hypothetical protein
MPTKTFYLDKESTEPIIINHGYNWKNLTITKDGAVIGQVENARELKKGRSFHFAEGRVLFIQLKQKWGYIPQVEILLNGSPIPGSGTEPNTQVRQAYNLLFFITAFNVGLGVIAELISINFLKTLGMGYGTIVIGLFFGLFGYLVKYKLSLGALYGAIGLMILDIIFTLVYAADTGGNPVSGLMMKGMFTFVLLNGIAALKKVKSENALLPAEHQA